MMTRANKQPSDSKRTLTGLFSITEIINDIKLMYGWLYMIQINMLLTLKTYLLSCKKINMRQKQSYNKTDSSRDGVNRNDEADGCYANNNN